MILSSKSCTNWPQSVDVARLVEARGSISFSGSGNYVNNAQHHEEIAVLHGLISTGSFAFLNENVTNKRTIIECTGCDGEHQKLSKPTNQIYTFCFFKHTLNQNPQKGYCSSIQPKQSRHQHSIFLEGGGMLHWWIAKLRYVCELNAYFLILLTVELSEWLWRWRLTAFFKASWISV